MRYKMDIMEGRIIAALLLVTTVALGQKPREVPAPNAPIDFTDINNLLLYIGGPLLFIIGFFLYRIYKKKQREKAKEEKEK